MQLVRHRRRRKNNIKTCFKEMWCENADCVDFTQEHGEEISGFIKVSNFPAKQLQTFID
jgi:hypothetical protein